MPPVAVHGFGDVGGSSSSSPSRCGRSRELRWLESLLEARGAHSVSTSPIGRFLSDPGREEICADSSLSIAVGPHVAYPGRISAFWFALRSTRRRVSRNEDARARRDHWDCLRGITNSPASCMIQRQKASANLHSGRILRVERLALLPRLGVSTPRRSPRVIGVTAARAFP